MYQIHNEYWSCYQYRIHNESRVIWVLSVYLIRYKGFKKSRYVGESTRSILDKPAKNLGKSVIRVAEEIFRILWFLDSI